MHAHNYLTTYCCLSIDIYFVDLEVSYDVLSPLPIVLSKHFDHPHPYIEIATTISDNSTHLTSKPTLFYPDAVLQSEI